jgi:hypothetical protein
VTGEPAQNLHERVPWEGVPANTLAIMTPTQHLRRARIWFVVMAAGLVGAGVTAFPLAWETRGLDHLLHRWSAAPAFAVTWIDKITAGIAVTGRTYPFIGFPPWIPGRLGPAGNGGCGHAACRLGLHELVC